MFNYWCGRTNKDFDYDRFMVACRVEECDLVETELDVEIAMTAFRLEHLHAEKLRLLEQKGERV
jgi:hypothetical protein